MQLEYRDGAPPRVNNILLTSCRMCFNPLQWMSVAYPYCIMSLSLAMILKLSPKMYFYFLFLDFLSIRFKMRKWEVVSLSVSVVGKWSGISVECVHLQIHKFAFKKWVCYWILVMFAYVYVETIFGNNWDQISRHNYSGRHKTRYQFYGCQYNKSHTISYLRFINFLKDSLIL